MKKEGTIKIKNDVIMNQVKGKRRKKQLFEVSPPPPKSLQVVKIAHRGKTFGFNSSTFSDVPNTRKSFTFESQNRFI